MYIGVFFLLKVLKMLNGCSTEYIPGNNILAYKMSECGESRAREVSVKMFLFNKVSLFLSMFST